MKRMGLILAILGIFLFAQLALADWASAKRITWTSGWSGYPSLATDPGGVVHLVWNDNTPGHGEVFYKRSADGGTTWTTNKRLTWSSISCYYPRIVADYLGHLHVVWQDYWNDPEICYKNSTDGGTTWTSKKRLSAVLAGSKHPAIAVDAVGNLYVAWVEGGVCFTRSTDGGTTWTSPKNIDNSGANTNFDPAIAAAGSGLVYVIWAYDIGIGKNELFGRTTTNGGAAWSDAKRLSWTSGESREPSLCYAYGNLHLAWNDDYPGNEEICYKKSTNGGSTWTVTKRLSWNAGYSLSPVMAILSSGNAHAVWEDTTPGQYEIYHRESPDGGATWTPARRITWNFCCDFAVAVDKNDKLHLVYRVVSDGPGQGELYYKAYQE